MAIFHIPEGKIKEVHEKLVQGIRDYAREHDFEKIVLGLSGGIDSSLVCALSVEAVGSENVLGISMPSKYSSEKSEEYAKILAKNLNIEFKVVPIVKIYETYIKVLEKDLVIAEDTDVEVYLQNIQARIRGNILMAFSNRYGHLVLATGNKSEAMMGYCTLYGDTVGGLSALSDVYKTGVYQLANYINKNGEVIPKKIIERIPSAELKPGQIDQDSLPPYEVLDEVLYYHVDKGFSQDEFVKKGFDPDTINKVISAVKRSEYKRKQCPPGIKID